MNTSSAYAPFKEKQLKLAEFLNDGSQVISVLKMNQFEKNLSDLGKKIENDTFKIQVVGNFSSGKSTVINSFLGSEILPAYATPTTAVINEVKYADERKAILYFRNPMPEHLPTSIPEQTMKHMRKYQMKNVPPIEISYDEIEDYAVIPMGMEAKEMLMENPYEKIELFWPLELLQNSIEIIDSPGLNEHGSRSFVTNQYLSKADAILFVMTANALCSAVEMEFIENTLRKKGFEDIYFLVNRFDTIPTKQRQRLYDYAKVKLSDQSNFGESGIFYISALYALEGKENNDLELVQQSGMPDFEKSLSEYLVNHKGKIKLSQPARELKRIINEEALFKVLPAQKAMLDSSLDDLKEKYNLAKPKLDQLLVRKNQMQDRINLLIEQMLPEIRRYINAYFDDLNNNISAWIDAYKFTTEVSITKVKLCAEMCIEELTDYLKDKIEQEQNVWLENTLQPLISDKVEGMLLSIEQTLENFFVELDTIKFNVTGANKENIKDVPLWQRITAAGGGILLGDIGIATLGGVTGFSKNFLKGLGIQLSAYIGLALFGLLNPVTIGIAIVAGIIRGGFGVAKDVKTKVKTEVKNGILAEINNTAFDNIENMMADIKEQISDIGAIIIKSMSNEISEAESQIEDVIQQMEKGQQVVDKRKAELASCEESIRILSSKLDDFIFQMIDR